MLDSSSDFLKDPRVRNFGRRIRRFFSNLLKGLWKAWVGFVRDQTLKHRGEIDYSREIRACIELCPQAINNHSNTATP
jgi:hypothetical protein